MQAVMITMEGREESADTTAANLAEAGVDVEIFTQPHDWEVGQASNNKNSKRAIKWAVSKVDGPGFLFVEDDLIINVERFKRAMEAASGVNEVVYFYMHDIPPRTKWYPDEPWIKAMVKEAQYRPWNLEDKMAKYEVTEGLRLMSKDAHMWGSQCVYIPKPYARFLFAFMDSTMRYSSTVQSSNQEAIDTTMNRWRHVNRLPTYVYLPHPVQHLQNRTRRKKDRKDVYSKSFGLVSNLEVKDGV